MDDFLLNTNQYQRLWEGTQVTLQVLGWSFVLGVALSLVIGVARLSSRPLVRGAALVYVELSRGVSSLVLLFWMAFALPILLGFGQPSLLVMASIALGANMGGYGSEIVRGAIQSVPHGQVEAATALNLTAWQRIRLVILPQAMPVILPPMGNLTIEILKGTALVSLIGLSDLAFELNKLRVNRTISDGPVSVPWLFLNGLLIYFVLAQLVNLAFRSAERRTARRFARRTGRSAVGTGSTVATGAGLGVPGGAP